MRKILLSIFILLQAGIAGDRLTTGFEFLRTDFNPRTAGTEVKIRGRLATAGCMKKILFCRLP